MDILVEFPLLCHLGEEKWLKFCTKLCLNSGSGASLQRHHRSFNHPARGAQPYGGGRSKYEFFPGEVRRQHSARRVHSSPVGGGGGGWHVAAAGSPSFGQRYTSRRANGPPPHPGNLVFERSRDDCSLEKSGPAASHHRLGSTLSQPPGFQNFAPTAGGEIPGDGGEQPFSFAGALRAEGAPSSLLRESLIRGAVVRSHSQLHRSVCLLAYRRRG